MASQLNKQTNTEDMVSRVWLYFAVQKSFGAIFETNIIEIEALSNQYCIAAWSIEGATLGTQKMCLHLRGSSPLLTKFTRIKQHTLASSK